MISLVIPVYNEEILIEELFKRVQSSMNGIGEDYEVILVDDGSHDNTLAALKRCNEKDRRFMALALLRNFGTAIGHFRRYNKKMLAPTSPASLQLKKIRYLDSMGLLAYLVNKYFLKQDYPTLDQIHFWNNLIVPFSRVTDILTNYSLGKTLIGI